MKIYLMTDLEGVAGVVSFEEWTGPGKLYYPVARQLLTQEVNAVLDGFFRGGATEVVVCDAHGPGAVNIQDLSHPVGVQYMRGWGTRCGRLNLDASYDAVAWVGQHAKAGTPYGHLCHTQSSEYIDESVNGLSIGEFGELALCAAELGVRALFAVGDEAFTKEAQALVPGLETVAVKRGLRSGTGEDLDLDACRHYVGSAVHLHPGARGAPAARRSRAGDGTVPGRSALRRDRPARDLPFERTIIFRPGNGRTQKTVMRTSHPTSFIGAMNSWTDEVPLEPE